jgi:peptide chain release factor 2
VYVFPVLDDTIEVDIRPEDLRVDTYRSGGAGGQHVNKTDSAVRFTHLPTGIVVACQSERSQTMNRATAMSILKARLYEYYREEKEKENQKFASVKKDISWGNQIRSYVFQPYTMVKDHRTKTEAGNIQSVMDGNIDQFIESYLKLKWKGLLADPGSDDGDDA